MKHHNFTLVTRMRSEWIRWHGHWAQIIDWQEWRNGKLIAHSENLWARYAVYAWQHGHWVFLFHR